MMEDYFNQPFDTKLKDARPEYGYQVRSLVRFYEHFHVASVEYLY